jgi:hypothetical protein
MKKCRCELASLVLILLPIFFNMACSGDPDQRAKNSLEELVKKAVDRTNNDPGIVWQIPPEISHDYYNGMINLVDKDVFSDEEAIEMSEYIKSYRRKWGKKLYNIKNAEIDIIKTDSIITPYKGTVIGYGKELLLFPFETKDQAEEVSKSDDKVKNFSDTIEYKKFKIEYTYKDNKWLLEKAYYDRWSDENCESELQVENKNWVGSVGLALWRTELGTDITPCGLLYKYWNN